jgi:quercetin dioxygenase-like cupin family protein
MLAGAYTQTLVRGKELEVIKLILPPGKEIHEHKAKGEVLVQCLEGQIALTACGKTESLKAGDFVYLPTGEPHSVRGVESASVLLTVVLPEREREADWGVEPVSAERDEVIRKRGMLLAVMQVVVLVGGFGLLLAIASDGILAAVVCVTAVLAVLACLHYWAWGRWMTRAMKQEGQTIPMPGRNGHVSRVIN